MSDDESMYFRAEGDPAWYSVPHDPTCRPWNGQGRTTELITEPEMMAIVAAEAVMIRRQATALEWREWHAKFYYRHWPKF